MCTIAIETLKPLNRISCIKMYKNNARSRLFCRIAKRYRNGVAADLRHRNGEISGCFQNSTSLVLQQCQNKVSFERKDSGIASEFSLNFQKEDNTFL